MNAPLPWHGPIVSLNGMKQILLILAVVALVGGCGGKKEDGNTGVVNPNKPSPKAVPVNIANPIVEKVIRAQLKKPTGELTQADLEKVPGLSLESHQLTDVKDLEKLPQLKALDLSSNKLTSVNGLEKLTQLTMLNLAYSPKLTDVKGLEKLTQLKELNLDWSFSIPRAQIAELRKALPNCKIIK